MKVLLLQGHPDPVGDRLCHLLARAYREGAVAAGHEVREISLAKSGVTLLSSEAEWRCPNVPPYVLEAQQAIDWADHLCLIFPLWLGGMPALVKAWLEQVCREGFAMAQVDGHWQPRLKHKSARLIVTMGMPAFLYRTWFGAHGTGVLRRSILGFAGVGPIAQTLIGGAGSIGPERLARLQRQMGKLGREGTRKDLARAV